MRKKFFKFSFIVLTLLFFSHPALADGQREQARLESLFIWKVSDALELSIEDEQKFTQILRDLADQKKKAITLMKNSVDGMKSNKGHLLNKDLKQYEAAAKSYSEVQSEEYKKLIVLLGEEKMARYLVLKHELTHKLRSLLTQKSVMHQQAKSKSP